ncbi:MAG: hypothetical protein QXT26_04945 [Thermoproteota archaeon]
MPTRKIAIAVVFIAMVLLPVSEAGIILCKRDSDFLRLYNAASQVIGNDYDWEIINFTQTVKDPLSFANASSDFRVSMIARESLIKFANESDGRWYEVWWRIDAKRYRSICIIGEYLLMDSLLLRMYKVSVNKTLYEEPLSSVEDATVLTYTREEKITIPVVNDEGDIIGNITTTRTVIITAMLYLERLSPNLYRGKADISLTQKLDVKKSLGAPLGKNPYPIEVIILGYFRIDLWMNVSFSGIGLTDTHLLDVRYPYEVSVISFNVRSRENAFHTEQTNTTSVAPLTLSPSDNDGEIRKITTGFYADIYYTTQTSTLLTTLVRLLIRLPIVFTALRRPE